MEVKLSLKIINSGILSLIQDLGRYGYYSIGLSSAGALDEESYLWADYLLGGNNNNAIEIFLGNFSCQFQADTNIAVTGAKSILLHNQKELPIWSRFAVKAGDIVEIKETICGNLNYLMVEGGFQLAKFKSSYATNFKLKIGANNGKKLTKQILKYQPAKLKCRALLNKKYIPDYLQNDHELLEIQIVLNPESTAYFSKADLQKFLKSTYSLSPDSDRMGIRLLGNSITPLQTDLPSEGLSYGTIQIPLKGLPIILLKDCQTIGGYTKLGYVSALDCFKLAQTRPKKNITFSLTSAEQSQTRLRRLYNRTLW